MWVCSATNRASSPRSSTALPSSEGWIAPSATNVATPTFMGAPYIDGMETIEELAAELRALRVRVEAAEAVLAIHELKARYADLVDRRYSRGALVGDGLLAELADHIAATFAADGVWDGGPVLGKAQGRD